MTTHELMSMLRARYPRPEWAFITEVANCTGAYAGRRCDALAMNMYPSRGLDLHGFEVKVSRSDWTKERKTPDKAEAVAKYCHFWWVVAPKGIVPVAEVPANWGLIEADGIELVRTKPASKLTPIQPDHGFIAAIMRRVCEQGVDADSLRAEYERGRKEVQDRWNRADKGLAENAAKLETQAIKRIKEFEEKSGLSVDTWQAGRVGDLVRGIIRGEDHLDQVCRSLNVFVEQAPKVISALQVYRDPAAKAK